MFYPINKIASPIFINQLEIFECGYPELYFVNDDGGYILNEQRATELNINWYMVLVYA